MDGRNKEVSEMMWYIGTIVGSIALVALNTLERIHSMRDWVSYLFILPLLILCNQGFWYGFHHAPNFIQVWFLGSGMVAVGGWLSHIFILKETVSPLHIIGFLLIFAGAFLLTIRG